MIGIDAVDIERLRTTLDRSPGLRQRLFTPAEQAYSAARSDPVRHLAGTLAAKEAVIKAARLGPLVAWSRRIEVERDDQGGPRAAIRGRPHRGLDVSISHDGGVAVAIAMYRSIAFGRTDGR